MKKLSVKGYLLLVILSTLFSSYPALSIMELRHGEVSYFKLFLLCSIFVALIIICFSKITNLRLNMSFGDIRSYLDARYSEEEQSKIITNYSSYKSRLFPRAPMFSKTAIEQDQNLNEYIHNVRNIMLQLFSGFLVFIFLTLMVFYLLAWV